MLDYLIMPFYWFYFLLPLAQLHQFPLNQENEPKTHVRAKVPMVDQVFIYLGVLQKVHKKPKVAEV